MIKSLGRYTSRIDRYALFSSLLPLLWLFLLPLILFAPVTLGSQTLLPTDNLFTFEPYRSVAAELGVGQPHNTLLSDLILENYAWKRFLLQSLEARELPLWNPYIFAGAPFLANGQHSALYPLSAVFYLLPLWRAYGIFTVLQLGLAGVSMFAFARALGRSRLAATIAGMIFQLSGFFTVSVVHPMIIAAASWLPLILAAAEFTIRQRPLWGRPATVPWALAGALALGFSTLAGHAEVLYFSLLVLSFYAAWRLLYEFRVSPTPPLRALIRPVGGLVAMVGLGLALGAIQLLPYIEVVSGSFREGGATLSQVRSWAYPIRRLLTFLVPNFFGNPAHHSYRDLFTGQTISSSVPIDWGIKNYVEGGAYLGLLPLFLAVLAILSRFTTDIAIQSLPTGRWQRLRTRLSWFFRHRHIPLFTVLSLLSLAFIFGTPLYAFVYALPFLSQSHSPFRWVYPLTLSVAVLAAFGVDVLRRTRRPIDAAWQARQTQQVAPESPPPPHNFARLFYLDTAPSIVSFLAALAFWGGAVMVAGLLLSRIFFNRIEPLVTRMFQGLALADTAFPDARAFYSYEFRWLLLAGLMLIATGIVLRVSRCPIYLPGPLGTSLSRSRDGAGGRRPIWEALAVLLLALDLIVFGWGFHAATDPALLDYTPAVVEFLKQDPGLWRLTTFDPRGENKTFLANAGWFYDLQDARGYDSLFSAQYRDYMRMLDPQDELEFNRIAPLRTWSGLNSPLLDMLNVKYVLVEEDPQNPDARLGHSPKYRLVYPAEEPGGDGKRLRVYENLGVMPRAYQMDVACTIVSDDPLVAMQEIDPRTAVILDADAGIPATKTLSASASPDNCAPGPAEVTLYTPNEVFIDVPVDESNGTGSWLVLLDSYAPGWKAFARPAGADEAQEQELAVHRVAGNFRGVRLAAGDWTVRFKYSPNSVKVGAFLSFLGAISGLFLAGTWLWRFFYRPEHDTSTSRRVAKNSVMPIAVNLMNRVVEMGFAALVARVLGPEGSGKYYYAIVIFGWFDILTNFGLNTLLLREVARDRVRANRYFANTTILRMLLVGLALPLLGIFLVARQTLLTTDLAPETVIAILLLFIGLVPTTIATGLTALFQAYERHEIPAAITSVATLVKVTLGTMALLLGWGIVGLAGVSIVTGLVTLAILAVLATRLFFRPRLESDWRLQRAMAVESFPLMLNHLLATLFFRVDIILLEAIRNRRAIPGQIIVGWYSWAYKGIDVLNIIPSMFTFAIFPVMARQAREDRQALNRTFHLAIKLLVVLALPAAMAMTLLAPLFIGILGGSAFLPDSAIALQLMVWSIPIGWINSVTNYVLIAVNQQRFLTRAFVAGLAFNLAGNLILVPLYDYRAAAIITIFSELVLLIAFYVGIRRHLAPVPWWQLLWRPGLAGALMVVTGLALLPVHLVLALSGSLGIYFVILFALGAFSAEEIALILGRPTPTAPAPEPAGGKLA
jgi:O-antigen/teichoic acid export membrane protein